MKTIGVGIIGCGSISSVHLNVIDSLDIATLQVVCDHDLEKAKAAAVHNHCKYVTDYHQLLSDESVEVVHILLPHDLHVEVAMDCLKAGKDVVLEKPVGLSMDAVYALKAMANKLNRKIGVTLQNRFNPTSLAMKEASKTMGEFKGATATLTWSREQPYYDESSWRGQLEREGGGLLINQAIHTLDLMRFIGGDIMALSGKTMNFDHPKIEVEDTAVLEFYYDNGAKGFFFGTNNHHENSNIRMIFDYEKGQLVLEDQTAYKIQNGQKVVIGEDQNDQGEKGYWGMGHRDCIHNIYRHILYNEPLFIALDEAIIATELVLGSYESNNKQCLYTMKGNQ